MPTSSDAQVRHSGGKNAPRHVLLAAAVGGGLGVACLALLYLASSGAVCSELGCLAWVAGGPVVLVVLWVPLAWALFAAAGLARHGVVALLAPVTTLGLGVVLNLGWVLAFGSARSVAAGTAEAVVVVLGATVGGYAAVAAAVRA